MTALAQWNGTGAAASHVRFNVTGQDALAILDNGTCHILDPQQGTRLRDWKLAGQGAVSHVEFSRDGSRVIVLHEGTDEAHVYGAVTGELTLRLKLPGPAYSIAVAADPRLLAVGGRANYIQIWNIVSGELLEPSPPRLEGTNFVVGFSSDASELICMSKDVTSMAVRKLPGFTRNTSYPAYFSPPLKIEPVWNTKAVFVVSEDRRGAFYQATSEVDRNARPSRGAGVAMAKDTLSPFFVQGWQCACTYRGDGNFEYRSVSDSAHAGGSDAEFPSGSVTALTPDGSLAATGHKDGTVRFSLPSAPAMTLKQSARDFNRRLRSEFDQKRYDELDAAANRWLHETASNRGGYTAADEVWSALGKTSNDTPAGRLEHIKDLEDWRENKPNSAAARLMLGIAHRHYAWSLRGGDVAIATAPSAMQGFQEQLELAEVHLKAAEALDPKLALLYSTWISVAMGLSKPKAEILQLWKSGVQIAPEYYQIHNAVAYALLPRWGGDPGDVLQLARKARDELPGDAGPIAYGIMAQCFAEYEGAGELLSGGWDLDDLKAAADARVKHVGAATGVKNFAALVACLSQDREAAQEKLRILAGNFSGDLWAGGVSQGFEKWANGSRHGDVPRSVFFPTLGGRVTVWFAEDPDELVVMSQSRSSELQRWNYRLGKRQGALPLPYGAVRPVLSTSLRYLAYNEGRLGGRDVLLDLTTQKTASWPGDGLFWFSADSKQFARLELKKSLSVYSLEDSLENPTHTIKVETGNHLNNIEFPSATKEWMLLAHDSATRLRIIKEAGIEPLPQKPVQAVHLRAVLGRPWVVVANSSRLSRYDFDTARLVDWQPQQQRTSETLDYTEVAVSRDGRLAAAARATDNNTTPNKARAEVEIWEIANDRRLHMFNLGSLSISRVAFSSDANSLATVNELGAVQIWDMQPALDAMSRE